MTMENRFEGFLLLLVLGESIKRVGWMEWMEVWSCGFKSGANYQIATRLLCDGALATLNWDKITKIVLKEKPVFVFPGALIHCVKS